MKSLHIACAAIAATGATLATVAMLGTPDRLIGMSYDHMLAAADSRAQPALVAEANAPGSEHFWLTQRTNAGTAIKPTLAVGVGISETDIKQAIATAGEVDAEHLEILNVQEIARASLGGAAPAGRSMLVTVRVEATDRMPARIVRFVLDAGTGQVPARAL